MARGLAAGCTLPRQGARPREQPGGQAGCTELSACRANGPSQLGPLPAACSPSSATPAQATPADALAAPGCWPDSLAMACWLGGLKIGWLIYQLFK